MAPFCLRKCTSAQMLLALRLPPACGHVRQNQKLAFATHPRPAPDRRRTLAKCAAALRPGASAGRYRPGHAARDGNAVPGEQVAGADQGPASRGRRPGPDRGACLPAHPETGHGLVRRLAQRHRVSGRVHSTAPAHGCGGGGSPDRQRDGRRGMGPRAGDPVLGGCAEYREETRAQRGHPRNGAQARHAQRGCQRLSATASAHGSPRVVAGLLERLGSPAGGATQRSRIADRPVCA